MVQESLAEPVLEVTGLKVIENILFGYIHWIIKRYQQLQFFVAHGGSPYWPVAPLEAAAAVG